MSNAHTQGIPGMDAMSETLDFVKNLWGGMSMPGMNMKIPGMIMPTLSVEEINKQIADLKTVESWLTLNMNMLRSTIQALEVQSATISALQAMGESLSAAVKPAPREEPPAAARKPEPEPEPEEPEARPPEVKQPEADTAAAPKARVTPQPDAAALANPAIWWNMLQDQFKQAVDSAMTAEAPKAAPAKPAPAKSAPAKAKKAGPKAAAPKVARKAAPKAAVPKAAAPEAAAPKAPVAKHAGTKGG